MTAIVTLPRTHAARGTFIAGTWQEGEGTLLTDVNPATGEHLANLRCASPEQAQQALAAAAKAQPAWGRKSYTQRAAYLLAIADAVEAKRDGLMRLLAAEVGKPVGQGTFEIDFVCDTLRYQAEWARRVTGEIIPSDDPDETIRLVRVPVGVVVAITAWNFPMANFFRKVAPALLAGNAVVLKPSETTPLSAVAMAEIIADCGLPPGVFNLVVGAGDIGSSLVSSPEADMVTMTGSVSTGRKVMRDAAENLTKVSLELGGKGPAIVWKDADLDLAVSSLVLARFLNSGQVCTCVERIYVHSDIADEFVRRYSEAVSRLRVGDPTGDVDMGPLATAAQLDKVSGLVSEALANGARAVAGGDPAALDLGDGCWYPPTVLVDVTPDSRIAREEVFGPVAVVSTISSLGEALDRANDTEYGLSGYLYTRDASVIARVEQQMQCGLLWINRTIGEAVQAFASGHKHSGIGGEDGYHGLLGYTELRSVYQHFGARPAEDVGPRQR